MKPRLALVAALGLAACTAVPAAAARTPAATRDAILAAGKAQTSVHYVGVTKSAQVQVTIVADAGPTEGIQQITFRRGTRTGHVTVVVSGSTAYVRGDAFTLIHYLGFASGGATRYANRWIDVPHSSTAFASIAAAVTLASAIDELAPQGRLSAAKPATIGGTKVAGVRAVTGQGSQLVVSTLYARASGTPLPVRETLSRKGIQATITLGPWNRAVHVTVPAKSVPFATVTAAGAPTA